MVYDNLHEFIVPNLKIILTCSTGERGAPDVSWQRHGQQRKDEIGSGGEWDEDDAMYMRGVTKKESETDM